MGIKICKNADIDSDEVDFSEVVSTDLDKPVMLTLTKAGDLLVFLLAVDLLVEKLRAEKLSAPLPYIKGLVKQLADQGDVMGPNGEIGFAAGEKSATPVKGFRMPGHGEA